MEATESTIDLRPGIYADVPIEKYLSWEAVRSAYLIDMARSPAFSLYNQIHSKKQTAAMKFGNNFHMALLEPKRFAACRVVRDPAWGHGNSNKYEQKKSELEADGIEMIDQKDWEKIHNMLESVSNNKFAAGLLHQSGAIKEVSMVWPALMDEEVILCKSRPDAFLPNECTLVEVKTAPHAGPDFFFSHLKRMGYHYAAAWKVSGLQALRLPFRHFYFIVPEQTPPYETWIYELSRNDLEEAMAANQSRFETFLDCRRRNSWPGAPEEPITIEIPKWGVQEVEDDEVDA